jgi:DMSO/TMAO reductase YedYZ molybdopterin-dependent catalytic subunit
LAIQGAVERPLTFTYNQLRELAADSRTATLDCTGGWYTTQEWGGVAVARLLEMAGVQATADSITFRAVSGYQRRFTLDEAATFLLALDVAGEPLSHGHGAPVRLVAVEKRGVEWVKWITEIHVNTTGKVWQLPLPLQ